jgi:hypothetical protein
MCQMQPYFMGDYAPDCTTIDFEGVQEASNQFSSGLKGSSSVRRVFRWYPYLLSSGSVSSAVPPNFEDVFV